ncbi:MAG: hypothetical protein KTR29_03100 [Rhodothermaceae bacterium]|nr:hypothetical protein [Rhodothermaceae bacterium]
MRTFSENLQQAWRHDLSPATSSHNSGLWLLMLKDNIENDSPEFGMMSIVLRPECGTCIGTFVYADQHEDISYQIEWAFQEPDTDQILDHYTAWDTAQNNHHVVITGREKGNPEVMGISIERPGEKPLIFVGIRMADDIPVIN